MLGASSGESTRSSRNQTDCRRNRSAAPSRAPMADLTEPGHGSNDWRSHLSACARSAESDSRAYLIIQPLYASEPTLPAVGARGGTTRKPQIGGKPSSLGAPLRSVSHEMNGSGCRGAPATASPFDLMEPRFRSMRQARSASSRVPAGATTRRAHRIGRGIRRRPRGPQRGPLPCQRRGARPRARVRSGPREADCTGDDVAASPVPLGPSRAAPHAAVKTARSRRAPVGAPCPTPEIPVQITSWGGRRPQVDWRAALAGVGDGGRSDEHGHRHRDSGPVGRVILGRSVYGPHERIMRCTADVCAARAGGPDDRFGDDAITMVSEGRNAIRALGAAIAAIAGRTKSSSAEGLTNADGPPLTIMPVAGRRSPVAGRRSPVAGRRSPVAGRRSPVAPPMFA